MDTLIILCLLGDPNLPAVSVKHTGGYQVDVQELLANINNPNCNIHVITNSSKYCSLMCEKHEKYMIHRVSFRDNWLANQNELMNNFDDIKREVYSLVKDLSTDNTLIHSFYWLSGILAHEISNELGINYVHTVVSLGIGKVLSGSNTYYNEQINWEKKFLKKAKAVFSITETEKKQLLKYYELNPKDIIVIGRGVHPVFENPCRSRNGSPNMNCRTENALAPIELLNQKWWMQGAFIYVGRIQIIKGLHCIIAAWLELYKEYGDNTPPLWISGGIPEGIQVFREELHQYLDVCLLKQAESNQKVVWWGYLDFAGISTLFLKSKVLVTHSQYEPGGRVLLEAMAASIPVIATPNGFAKDLIINETNGFIVPYGDISALREKMSYFITNPQDAEILGRNARKTFLEQKKLWRCYEKQFYLYKKYGLDSF